MIRSMGILVKGTILLIAVFFGQQLWKAYQGSSMPEPEFHSVDVKDLEELTKEYATPQVLKVTEKIHMAIGFALANSMLIEAPDGLIIVDTTESQKIAQEIYQEFRKISSRPIKAIMYTHNHADHTFGAQSFIEDPDNLPEIWAQSSLPDELRRVVTTGAIVYKRAMRQFGTFLTNITNAGIGLRLKYEKNDQSTGVVMPTHLFKGDKMNVSIAGLPVTLYHIPGESYDHMGIWIDKEKIFFCGDNLYRTFPNLYAIRGTPPRNLKLWIRSLDIIRQLKPEILIPSHTRPIYGQKNIEETVTLYRDAIQMIHDQTVRWMNKGEHPIEISRKIKFPPQMSESPFLKELYGTIEWSSKGVFDQYIGWFSGDVLDLSPLTFSEKATRTVELTGGTSKMLEAAQKALANKDHQWALELSSYVLHFESTNHEAARIKLAALVELGNKQTSANGKNYYWTTALEFSGKIELPFNPGRMIKRLPLSALFMAMSTRVMAESCGTTLITGQFNFTDINEMFTLHLRNSILEVIKEENRQEAMQNPDFLVKTTSPVWRSILAQERSPVMALASGELEVGNGYLSLKEFMDCIDKDNN